MASEKVAKIGLSRDYKKFLYYLSAEGDVMRKSKTDKSLEAEVVVKKAVTRDNRFLYYIDKDGDVSRAARAERIAKKKSK